MVLFLVIPIVMVIFLSLVQWNLLTPMKWVGLSNYVNIFEYDEFGHSLMVTAYYVILNIPIQTVLALGMAMLLRSKRAGSGVIRIIAVLPFLSTPVAMGVVWNWFFTPPPAWSTSSSATSASPGPPGYRIRPPRCRWSRSPTSGSTPATTCCSSWPACGAIPLSMYEAASLDGASKLQQFRRVTLPLLRPTMLFVLVTGVIGSFQVFDTVYVMTGGGPGIATQVANLNIYNTAFQGFRIGEASAMSVVLFLVILVITVAQFRYFNKRTTYEIA